MQSTASPVQTDAPKQTAEKLVLSILLAAAFCHFLNDMVQSLIPAIYPILKKSFHLDFGQIGMITLTYQITASLLQPLIGHFNDRHPRPYSLAIGMGFTLVGLIALSRVSTYPTLLMGAALVGIGSAVFHPGVLPRGAHGLGRTARLRASAVSSGRQRRIVVGSAAGGLHRRCRTAKAAWRGFQRWRCSASSCWRESVPGPRRTGRPLRKSAHREHRISSLVVAAQSLLVAHGVDRSDVFEVLLSVQPEQLLHVLSDE